MLKPGELVGPYEIRGFVGQGGMGQVYRAFDPRLERTVALKVIAPSFAGADPPTSPSDGSGRPSGEGHARLLREARAVASLNHPNVVSVFDVGESNGRLYLAMEYVVGTTLRALVGQEDVPTSRKIRWLADVARALDVAHKAGLVHRDVKPENVMIREDGGVKVLDFGIARRTRLDGAKDDPQAVDTVTGGGAIAGTPVYMAPEQIKGGEIDARCDQFAWGVTAYELLGGERPWPETGDVLSLVAKVLTDPPRSLRARAKELPAVVEETILRALAKDPAARFPSMGAIADAIEPFATTTTGGERVRITPPAKDDPAAYAATTRVPTTVSVDPDPNEETKKGAKPPARARGVRLLVPLLLIGVLGGAVVLVRKKMGTTPPTVPTSTSPTLARSAEPPRPLSTVPEAEAKYKEAMSLWRDGASAKSSAALRRAIELDPTFAAAHLELAIQMSSSDPGAAQAAFQSAFEQRHMLTARDAALLEASVPYVRPKPDLEEWVTRMTSMVFQFPRDPELQFYLGRAHEQLGEDDAARSAYLAAVKIDDGFVPALAALANVEKNLGHVKEALAATDRCLARSPVASTCVETRYDVFFATSDCHRAREEATSWGALEPQSWQPAHALARALYADGAPRPAVEEVLGRKWSLLPSPEMKKRQELVDRVQLAVIDGDLAKAEELAREFDGALALGADRADRAVPARLRANFLMEMEKNADAAKVAHAYLDKMAAWPVYPFAPDPSIDFYEPLYRAGEITASELDEHRQEWIAQEKKRASDKNPRLNWNIWTSVYGGFAETPEEARAALDKKPAEPLPPEAKRPLVLDFALGKTLVLANEPSKGIPHLRRVLATCAKLDASLLVMRAQYYLARAEAALGEHGAAKTAYEKLVQSWPKGAPSKTVRLATEQLALGTRD